MKLFSKFILCVLIIGLVGLFVVRSPDGSSYLQVGDFLPQWRGLQTNMKHQWNKLDEQLSEMSDAVIGDGDKPTETQVYRWLDDDGVWQFSDTPPEGVETERLLINTAENVVLGKPPQVETDVAEKDDSTASEPSFGLPLPLTIAPEQVPELMQDAQQVQELMQQRNEVLESISGEVR